MNRFGFRSVTALLLLIGTAEASQQGHTAAVSWKAADKCAKQAQAAFPDYNAESNAKRDAKLKECLSAGSLPPREPTSSKPPR
jgi:hypothetical protein